jgi:hypothetical protein
MKPILVIAATMIVLVVIWVGDDLLRTRSCEELLEQSTPSLHASLAFLQAKGEVTLGRTQVKALAEGADKLNAQFKGCCVARQKNYIGAQEYASCLRRAQAYEGKVREVQKSVEQSREATASRDPNRATQYAERAQEMARIALGSVIAIEPVPLPPVPTATPKPDAAIGGGPRNADEDVSDAADDRHAREHDASSHARDAHEEHARD